jgi:opacity protein-like surface antigen
MKQLFATVLLVSSCSAGLLAQDSTSFSILFGGGYTSFQLDDMKKVLRNGADYYTAAGVPVHPQVNFPSNAYGSVEATVRGPIFRYALRGAWTQTMGFFGYQDVAGRLRLKSTVSAVLIRVSLTYPIASGEDLELYVGGGSGLMMATWKLEQEVVFTNAPEENFSDLMTASAVGYQLEPVLGLRYRLFGNVLLEWEAGYRYTPVTLLDAEGEELKYGIDLSGFEVGLSVGVDLW